MFHITSHEYEQENEHITMQTASDLRSVHGLDRGRLPALSSQVLPTAVAAKWQ
jgi:hypothetical protein